MCINNQESGTELYYVKTFYSLDSSKPYLLKLFKLSNGNKIENVIDALLGNDEKNISPNNKDSYIKEKVDLWYENNILNQDYAYEKMLENTIFCNDRRIKSPGFLDKNGAYLKFVGGKITDKISVIFYNQNNMYICENKNDQFTVKNENNYGNSKLKYPIGLLSSGEVSKNIAQFSDANSFFWLGTPSALFNPIDYVRIDSASSYISTSFYAQNLTDWSAEKKPLIILLSH